MCTVLLPPGVNPIAVKYVIYHIYFGRELGVYGGRSLPCAIAPYPVTNAVVGVGPTDLHLCALAKKHLAGQRFRQTPT